MIRRLGLVFSTLLTIAISAVALASPAHADLGLRETPDQTWMTSGNVYAQALSEDGKTLYIGGKFKQLREKPPGTPGKTLAVNNVAAIDVATGTPVSNWRPAVTGDSSTNTEVRALAAKNGRVYIGGTFASVDGQPRRNLAAVDAVTGAVSSSFDTVVGDSTSVVYGLAANDSRLYVGGKFAEVDGTRRGNLAALDSSSGALDADWKARTNGLVRKLAFDSSGATVFAVGAFGGEKAVSNGGVFFKRQSVARFDAATGSVHPWATPDGAIQTDSGRGGKMTCWSATVTPTRLYLACGLGPNYAVALRLDNGNSGDRVWQTGFVGNPQSSTLSPDGSRLIVGGHFGINPLDQQVCGGRYLKGLVALNPDNGAIDCSWIPSLDQKSRPDYDGAWTLLTAGDQVWVGGGFVGVSGVPQTNLARFTYDPTLKTVNAAPTVDLDGLQRGGLDATYFDNADFTGSKVSRTDPTVDFDWGNGSPDPDIGPDTFSARWSGQVEAPASGGYTFTTNSDDGVRLFVDGRQVIDNWTDHGPTDDSAIVTLEAGKRYDVQLDFYENGGGAVARLHWSHPGQARQAVPPSSLFFSGGTNHAATFTAGAGPTPIVDRNNLAVTDADDANIRSATMKLLDNPDGGSELLSADTAGTAVAASYDTQTGTLSLTGPATKAAFQQVLRTVSYDNACANPTGGDRRMTFVVNDGSVDSAAATSTVDVRGADGQPPTGECTPPGGAGDVTAPTVQTPTHDLSLPGSSFGTSAVPVKARWSATDVEGDIDSYELQYSRNGGAYQDVPLKPVTTTEENVFLSPGGEYRFRVRATDSAGNTSGWVEGQPFALDVAQEESHGLLAYSGTWADEALATAFDGNTRHSNQAGSAASFTFTGADVSWAAQKGPDRGKAEVWLDGVRVETIDLYTASEQPRRIVYSATLDSDGPHTLEVRVLGTKRAASTDRRVDVDAFAALR